MFGIGFPELIVLAVVVFIVIVMGIITARRGGGSIRFSGLTLVLRTFKIDEAPSANILVDIVGRGSGIITWLLTIIGFDAVTSLKVTDKEVTFKRSSLFGKTYQVISLPSVSSTHCGYSKPLGYLIMGVIFLVGGILSIPFQGGGGGFPRDTAAGLSANSTFVLIGLVIGGIFLLAYFLSKKIFIFLETYGGMILGISFKRSVIENVSVDMEQALKAIEVINKRIIASQVKNQSNKQVGAEITVPSDHKLKVCPKCQMSINDDELFCTNCGNKLFR